MRISVLLLLVLSCNLVFSQTSRRIRGRGFKGVVFTPHYEISGKKRATGQRFEPSKDQIVVLERLLKERISNINAKGFGQGDGNPIIHENLTKYIRQYVGYVNENGDQVVEVNFLWKRGINKEWKSDLILFFDGGSRYWNIRFNLATKKFQDFMVNSQG